MPPRLAAFCLLLSTGSALASEQIEPLGWTSDGSYFVRKTTSEIYNAGDPTMSEESPHWNEVLATVTDVRTGASARYVVSITSDDPKSVAAAKKQYHQLGDAKAFASWLAAHPLKPALGRAAPDRSATAEVACAKCTTKAWDKDTFNFENDDVNEPKGTLVLSVSRGGKVTPSQVWTVSGMGGGMLNGDVKVSWSPDGKRVAWVVRRGRSMMNDEGQTTVLFGPAKGPRVELLAEKALLPKVEPGVREKLDGAGFVVVNAGPAQKARTASVVYAAKGFEVEAKKLAAAVPGGASVEALSWKAEAELVLALGSSALPAGR